MESFQKCILSCNSQHDSKTLGERLSQVTAKDIETAAKNILDGKESKNATLKSLFSRIRGHCRSLGHSNEAAMAACQKLFAL